MTGRPERVLQVLYFAVVLWLVFSVLAAAPVLAQEDGWQAEFYDNPTLSGSPVLTRTDTAIDFDWELSAPGDGVPADHFSARWTRSDWFDGGTYLFHSWSDDGLRVWVDGDLVIDRWYDQQVSEEHRDVAIPQGQHTIVVEYYEQDRAAAILFEYSYLGAGQGWTGLYYPNTDLSGSPVMASSAEAINFDWFGASPGPAVPADDFSVRWTRTVGFDAGNYRFFASADDGLRLWVDEQLVIDAWYNQELPNTHSGDISLSGGTHQVRVEYYENGGNAHAHIWWQSLDLFSGWKGEYFDNQDLVGGPTLVRDDAEINFDWGSVGPMPWISDDAFGVRWTRQMTLMAGYYRVSTRSDDGVRVWVDGGMVIDKWQPMEYELHYVDGIYLEGVHQFQVEYYEEHGHARVQFWISPAGSDEAISSGEVAQELDTPADPPPTEAPTSVPAPVTPADSSAPLDWWTLRGYRYVLMDLARE